MEKFWIVNKLDAATAEILLYGYIGLDEITSIAFVKELKGLEKIASKINIRINSGGGSIFEGIAMFNAIRNSSSEITAYVDGLAASMASILALAPKKVFMSKAAMFMTHRASGVAIGNSGDLRDYAALMDNLEKTMCTIYAQKTGLSEVDAKARYMGNDDKWFTAAEAFKEKLVDGIYDAPAMNFPGDIKNEKALVNYYSASMKATVVPNLSLPQEHETVKLLSVEDLLKEAIKQNNITPEQAALLKKQYSDDVKDSVSNLKKLLDEFAKIRLRFLMNSEWSELDKSDMAAELNRKFPIGYRLKYFLEFGRDPKTNLKNKNAKPVDYIDIDELIKWAVENKLIDEEIAKGWVFNFGKNPDKLLKMITDIPLNRLEGLMNCSWELLDKMGCLEELKEMAPESYKEKFKARFGVYPREDK